LPDRLSVLDVVTGNHGAGAEDQLAEFREAQVLFAKERMKDRSRTGGIARLQRPAGQGSPLRPNNDRHQQSPFRSQTGRSQRHRNSSRA
jgi:hypothetical protein